MQGFTSVSSSEGDISALKGLRIQLCLNPLSSLPSLKRKTMKSRSWLICLCNKKKMKSFSQQVGSKFSLESLTALLKCRHFAANSGKG